jgi:PST family polysaccharide transporter
MLISAGVGKSCALIGQIILGWLLFAEDWGIYALALSLTAFVQILRDGGVGQIIIQSGKDRYEEVSGPAFWMAFAFNLVAAAILLFAAPVVAAIYSQPDLSPMLWVAAAAFICGTPLTILRANLSVNLRFSTGGGLQAASSILRWAVAVGLAAYGLGPMSFMWAMLAATVFEGLLSWAVTGDQPWARRPSFATWPDILRKSLWAMIGGAAAGLSSNGAYFILGALSTIALVGQYSFGAQLAAQLGALLVANIQSVLFPILTRLSNEPHRMAAGVERTISVLFLVSSAPAILLAALAQPLELLLWNGKWADAVIVIQIFSVIAPIRMLIAVTIPVLLAHGRFAAQAGIHGADAVVLMGAVFLASTLYGEDLASVATTIGVIQAAFALAVSLWILKIKGCNLQQMIFSMVRPWGIACLIGGAIWLPDQVYFSHFPPVVRTVLIGVLFTASFGLLARLFLVQPLQYLLAVAPKKISNIVAIAMRLPPL